MKDMIDRFWNDFHIPTQEETLEVAFANPADVANALIKSRNWAGTITQELVSIEKKLTGLCIKETNNRKSLNRLERDILSKVEITSTSVKTLKVQQAFIRASATDEEKAMLDKFEQQDDELENKVALAEGYQSQLERIRRTLEKTTDWLVQYINWNKFELRELT